LERVTPMLDRPVLAGSSVPSETGAVIRPLATPSGQVAVDVGAGEPHPVVREPTVFQRGDRTYLLTTGVWPLKNSSVRLAHDITSALPARRDLREVPVGARVVATVVAGGLAVVRAAGQ